MDAIEIFKLLKEDRDVFDKVANKLSNTEIFTNEDIRELIIKANEAKLINKNREISMRKAMIIIYEEYLQKEGMKRGDYEYEFIYEKSSVRYVLKQRNKTRFPTLEITHPEYPCRVYEDFSKKKFHYTKALEEILVNACWLIENDKAELSLKEIYNEVKLC